MTNLDFIIFVTMRPVIDTIRKPEMIKRDQITIKSTTDMSNIFLYMIFGRVIYILY